MSDFRRATLIEYKCPPPPPPPFLTHTQKKEKNIVNEALLQYTTTLATYRKQYKCNAQLARGFVCVCVCCKYTCLVNRFQVLRQAKV